jgi:hypothetical protein
VKPFSMALIAWLFFRYVFSPWISPTDADQYIAGGLMRLFRVEYAIAVPGAPT